MKGLQFSPQMLTVQSRVRKCCHGSPEELEIQGDPRAAEFINKQ